MKFNISILLLLLCVGCTSSPRTVPVAQPQLERTVGTQPEPLEPGPTVNLCLAEQEPGTPVEHFMYFVPLISPEPVRVLTSGDNAQRAHLLRVVKGQKHGKITLQCDFALRGEGICQHVFDQSRIIDRQEEKLRKGGTLDNLMGNIIFSGEGKGKITAEGALIDGKVVLETVRIGFWGDDGGSPVSIGLLSVRKENGKPTPFNEIRVEISALKFTRTKGDPKMDVTVSSVKDQAATDSMWENFKGAIKGTLANLFIPPVSVEAVGNNAILDFAQAIYAGAPYFTFPLAKNLVETKEANSGGGVADAL